MITEEYILEKYKDLFDKNFDGLEIGAGWLPIINGVCLMMLFHIQNDKPKVLPVITQVKEKFGGLRIYVDNMTPAVRNYTDLAEVIAEYTCEVCGKQGKQRGGGWIKTLCEEHALKTK